MNGDDISSSNDTMPYWPRGMKLHHKVLCLLGYHFRETRQTGPHHKYPGMKLRDQCGRCGALL
jgi:hypothetical protein